MPSLLNTLIEKEKWNFGELLVKGEIIAEDRITIKDFLSQSLSRIAIAYTQEVLREANGEKQTHYACTFYGCPTPKGIICNCGTEGYNAHHDLVARRGEELLGNNK